MDCAKKTKVVLLSCGSFNPVTNMHLRMFELARDHLEDTGQYEVVKGIISPVGDGYKKKGLIEACHRVEMAKLAVESSSWIKVDSWESRQADWQETVKVLRHHREELLSREQGTDAVVTVKAGRKRKRMDAVSISNKRKHGKVEVTPKELMHRTDGPHLMLLCGADVLESFGVPGLWKNQDIEEIVGSYGLVCITRSSFDVDAFIQRSDLLWPHRRNIHVVPKKTKVVLLSCGSYNPITDTKLCMFEAARDHLDDTGQYEVVKGIISSVGDGYKKKGLIEASHRVEMAKLAVEDYSWIEVDSWESRQAEWLETVKVLRHHRQELLCQEQDTDVVGTAKAGRKRKRMDASSATKRRKLEEVEIAPKGPPQKTDEPRLMLLCDAELLDSFVVPGLWKPEHIEEIANDFGLVCMTRRECNPEAIIRGSDLLWPHYRNIYVVRN